MFQTGQAFPSAARTASPTAVVVALPSEASSLELVINVTAITATPSVVFNIDFPDGEGNWGSAAFLASAAVVATGVTRLRIGPNIAAVANVAAQGTLPEGVRIRPVHADADSITYSVSYWVR